MIAEARHQTCGAAERLERLRSLAAAIAARHEELVDGIVQSSHKIRRIARAEVDLAVARLDAFDELAPLLEAREPVGTVALVLPGNASLSNPVSTIGSAFLAGNEVVARFPGALRSWGERLEPLIAEHLPGVRFDVRPGPDFLRSALADPGIEAVMVFGDDAWAAGYEPLVRAARKKVIFEGPGKDPFLVLPGADLDRAARDAVRGACYNAGQACTSPERFYVHRDLFAGFVDRVVELTRQEVLGDPGREDVTVGPIASRRVVERIERQLREAFADGARVLAGGRIEAARLRDGTPVAFVEPTVLTGVDAGMALLREETYGPVLPILAVGSAEEAVRQAVAHRYGLAASLYGGSRWEEDGLARAHGMVFRNEIWLDYYGRHLHAPYGGRKLSGWVWEQVEGRFVHRDGPRINVLELSRPAGEGSRPFSRRTIRHA